MFYKAVKWEWGIFRIMRKLSMKSLDRLAIFLKKYDSDFLEEVR